MCLEPIIKKINKNCNIKVILDCNNIAYSRNNQVKSPSVSDILLLYKFLLDELKFKKKDIICICDPALKYRIDKPIEFQALLKERLLIEAPKVADEFILSYGLKYEFCFIISNDKFREYIDQLPYKRWVEDRRISFLFINDQVCLSPNINIEEINKVQPNDVKSKKSKENDNQITTLNILEKMEEVKGELDLY